MALLRGRVALSRGSVVILVVVVVVDVGGCEGSASPMCMQSCGVCAVLPGRRGANAFARQSPNVTFEGVGLGRAGRLGEDKVALRDGHRQPRLVLCLHCADAARRPRRLCLGAIGRCVANLFAVPARSLLPVHRWVRALQGRVRLAAVGASAWPSFAASWRGSARRACAFARAAALPARLSRPDRHQLLQQLVSRPARRS